MSSRGGALGSWTAAAQQKTVRRTTANPDANLDITLIPKRPLAYGTVPCTFGTNAPKRSSKIGKVPHKRSGNPTLVLISVLRDIEENGEVLKIFPGKSNGKFML